MKAKDYGQLLHDAQVHPIVALHLYNGAVLKSNCNVKGS